MVHTRKTDYIYVKFAVCKLSDAERQYFFFISGP
jgi:hypothetical protein